jgi:hypothetical protein
MHTELAGHTRDRARPRRGVLPQLDGHPGRALTQLVAVLLGCSHDSHPPWIESLHQTRGDSYNKMTRIGRHSLTSPVTVFAAQSMNRCIRGAQRQPASRCRSSDVPRPLTCGNTCCLGPWGASGTQKVDRQRKKSRLAPAGVTAIQILRSTFWSGASPVLSPRRCARLSGSSDEISAGPCVLTPP